MLKTNNKIIIFTALFSMFLFSCNVFITFEYLEITCSAGVNQNYYYNETVDIHFSHLPDKNDVERKIRFLEDGSTILADYIWQDSVLSIRPRIQWQKGQFYSIDLQGALKMDDGRTYTASLYRNFIYGEQGNSFELLLYEFNENIFTLQFSKPVSIISFEERFSIMPFSEYNTDFQGDGSTVIISPRNSWAVNTAYLWTIRNMVSKDGYLMKKNYSGMFSGITDTEQPEFEFVCPVDYSASGSLWHTVFPLDNQLLIEQAIGFSFSKPMDEASVISGINFFPSISGYFIKETETRFIFIPNDHYQLQREYRITISDSIRDTSGLPLFEPKHIFFTIANQFLQVTEITFDDNTNPVPADETIYEYTMLPVIPVQLKTVINFSTSIPQNMRNDAVNAISLNVLFPASANNPTAISAYWSDGGSRLSIEWSGFSISSGEIKNYYILTISGGQSGVKNTANEYLKEDVCVIFIAL